MMLKEKCSSTDAEWEERQKTRQLEMEACSKALAVLSSDEAHDLFTKTFNPAFIQEEESNQRRTAAAPTAVCEPCAPALLRCRDLSDGSTKPRYQRLRPLPTDRFLPRRSRGKRLRTCARSGRLRAGCARAQRALCCPRRGTRSTSSAGARGTRRPP